jgi:type IV pilus assembly protein PilM
MASKSMERRESLATTATFRRGIYKSEKFRRMARWFNALPHPPLAIEISTERVTLVRWSRSGALEDLAVEALRPGVLAPSAVEANIVDLAALKSGVESVCKRLLVREGDAALLLPDPVIRVFVQHFEDFPRSSAEAQPLLRWRLRKSVPFDLEEMLVSYTRQAPRENGVNVVTALARLPIVREYEDVVRASKLRPGVVLSSAIAAVALVDDKRPALMVRIAGNALTTAIVRGGMLCGYRCTELPAHSSQLVPRMLLDEIFPVAAYFQDTWQEKVQSVVVSGLGARMRDFVPLLEGEFHCPVHSLLQTAIKSGRVPEPAQRLADRELEGLLGWMWYRA